MCGIFGYLGKQTNAGDMILDGLKSLEYRGYDSWGIVAKTTNGDLHTEKHVGKIGNASLPQFTSSSGIGHTRWATHGGVTEANSHPHTDCTNSIIVVHNGIIENYEDIKNNLNQNHVYKSETDTEVFAHLLEERLKNNSNLRQVVWDAFKETTGMSAIIVYIPKTNEFVAVKNGSPLIFGAKDTEYFLASDASALSPHTDHVYFMNDHELLHINPQGYELFRDNQSSLPIKFTTLNYTTDDLSLGDYSSYMMKEISEQPRILNSIALEQEDVIRTAAESIRKAYGTYFIGCGTAYYACLAATYLFSKIAHRHTNASTASEFTYSLDFLTDKSLVIPLSQSGETIDIISSLNKVKEKKASIMAITNGLGSTLYRIADHKILLGAGPEKCVLATKSFTAKIAYLYLIAHALNGTLETGTEHIQKAAKNIEKLLENQEQINSLAESIKDSQRMFILGRGISYPTALESALKIKEVSYIHAEGFAAGELKHGVIALIEKGTPVIIYNPVDETYEDTLSSAHEVKARGAYVIGISSKKNDVYDEFIQVDDCNDATVIPNVVVAQLLGYYLATLKGYDVDKPRNLAKSVTVK